VFILPSHFEGHPKTLIEAMACGLPVIGADTPGINNLIRHGETGFLCGTEPEQIREAIVSVLGDAGLRQRLGRNARDEAMATFSLDAIVQKELAVLEEAVSGLAHAD
jgi:glycosyltransferase involved in cell wall biosynthesis